MNYEIEDKSKFAFGNIITDAKANIDFEYIEESQIGVCPYCGKALGKKQIFKIIELISIDNGKHFVGYSDKGHTLKIDKKYIPKNLID